MNTLSLTIHVQWRAAVTADNGQGYSYPQALSPFMRKQYDRAAVYRWRIHPSTSGKLEELYIGETESLAKRVRAVLSPQKTGQGGVTNRRLKEIFGRETVNKRYVFLDWADFEPFEINEVRFSKDDLWDRYKRLVVENILLCLAERNGHILLNKRVDPREKQVLQYLRSLPIERRRQILEKYAPSPLSQSDQGQSE